MSSAARHPERDAASGLAYVNEWDSEFFGLRIATVASRGLDDETAAAVLTWAGQNGIACLYYRADARDTASIQHAEHHGFRFVSIRLTMTRDGETPGPLGGDGAVRQAATDDVKSLEQIARASHTNTRFHLDTRFDRERSRELYAVWIRDSVSGRLADRVLVVDGPDGPAGYVALRADADGIGHIGLIAVSAVHRGRGYGERLVAEGLRWLASREVARVQVVTQGADPAAIRFYERCGFSVSAVELWFHRWLS